jgi:mannose-6-phosphate isomerase-like protein (cupin superfamily)
MPKLVETPARIAAAGTKPKLIDEFIGRVSTRTAAVSVARMVSPSGWQEPGQTPEFDEITVVLRGTVRVEHHEGVLEVHAGQAVLVEQGEWVRYSTPGPEGAEYIAVCLPAFSPETVHRESGGGHGEPRRGNPETPDPA